MHLIVGACLDCHRGGRRLETFCYDNKQLVNKCKPSWEHTNLDEISGYKMLSAFVGIRMDVSSMHGHRAKAQFSLERADDFERIQNAHITIFCDGMVCKRMHQ